MLRVPGLGLFVPCSCSPNKATHTRNTQISLASLNLCRKSCALSPLLSLPFNISFLLQEEQSVPGLDYWAWQGFWWIILVMLTRKEADICLKLIWGNRLSSAGLLCPADVYCCIYRHTSPEIPVPGPLSPKNLQHFCTRLEHSLVMQILNVLGRAKPLYTAKEIFIALPLPSPYRQISP